MFAKYDNTNFPIIYIYLNGTIKDKNDFENFINKWLEINNNKKDYEFIFNTKNCGLVHPKYCFYMALFIKKLKKEKNKYLKKSTIYVYNKYIFQLLKIIFYFEKPIAPVEIIFEDNNKIIKKEIITPF